MYVDKDGPFYKNNSGNNTLHTLLPFFFIKLFVDISEIHVCYSPVNGCQFMCWVKWLQTHVSYCMDKIP